MNNNPKLRFKEFNNNWNNFALKEFCIINPNNNKTLPNTFFYIDLESVINGQIACKLNAINKDNAPSRAARILQVNDLLYQTVRPYQRNNYLFSNELELPTVASTGYAQIRTTKNSIKFLYQLIHTDRFVNNVMKRCTGTSYPAINSTDLSNIIISVPNIEEQEKIAGFLSKVDELINECEGEVKDLEEQKKGLMQKIFSQQIRFKDSNNNPYSDWKEKKLGDVSDIQRGGSPRPIENYLTDDINGINWIKIGDVSKDSNVINATKEKIKPEGKNKSRFVTKGDLLLSNSMSFGRPYILNVDGCIHDGWLVIRNYKKAFNTNFLCYILDSDLAKSQYKKLAAGGVVINLNKELVASTKFFVPCQEEQEKIAKVLSKMDELIEEKKALLSDWQQFKKGLLQQMFV